MVLPSNQDQKREKRAQCQDISGEAGKKFQGHSCTTCCNKGLGTTTKKMKLIVNRGVSVLRLRIETMNKYFCC